MRVAPQLKNKGPRAKEYSCTIPIPRLLLTYSTATYMIEIKPDNAEYRLFRITEANRQSLPLQRDDTVQMMAIESA